MGRAGPSAATSASSRGAETIFAQRVLEVIASTQPGDLLTYSEVAREAGAPGAARAVGNILRQRGGDVPWWRVVTTSGRLAPGSEERQAALLVADGVVVRNGRVALRPPQGD